MSALGLEVFSVTIQDMYILFRTVDVIEKIGGHEGVVALGMLLGQTYILVHVEGEHILERHTTFLVSLHQVLVHANRRGTSRQTQHKLMLGCGVEVVDALDNILGSPT